MKNTQTKPLPSSTPQGKYAIEEAHFAEDNVTWCEKMLMIIMSSTQWLKDHDNLVTNLFVRSLSLFFWRGDTFIKNTLDTFAGEFLHILLLSGSCLGATTLRGTSYAIRRRDSHGWKTVNMLEFVTSLQLTHRIYVWCIYLHLQYHKNQPYKYIPYMDPMGNTLPLNIPMVGR